MPPRHVNTENNHYYWSSTGLKGKITYQISHKGVILLFHYLKRGIISQFIKTPSSLALGAVPDRGVTR